jgi:hypothetical protein
VRRAFANTGSLSFGALLGCGATLIALSLVARQAQWADDFDLFVPIAYAQGAVYALCAFVLLQGEKPVFDRRWVLVTIIAVAVILRLIALATPPNFLSTDLYRYIWDGRVQGAGVNPYLYVPADPALASLRDEAIYPLINRVDRAPTIYAPFAQLVFFAVTRFGDDPLTLRLGMLGFEAMAVLALAALLKRCGLPLERLALYVWHPLALWEITGGAHVDAIMLAGILAALLAASSGRRGLTGALLAAATLTKFLPLVVAPALYRRWDWRMPAAFLAIVTLLYGFYASWDGAGSRVLGFLPGYASEEGLSQGSGLFIQSLLQRVGLSPLMARLGFAAIAIAALGSLTLRSLRLASDTDTRDMMLLAAGLSVATITLLSPHYPWYFCWIVAFIPFFPRYSLIYLTTSVFYIYVTEDPASMWTGVVIYGPFLALFALEQGRQLSPRLQEGSIS